MEFLSRHKRAFIIIMTLICLLSIILSLTIRDKPTFLENILGYVVTPVQQFATGVGDWFGDKFSYFKNIDELEAENQSLRDELESLKADNRRYRLVQAENTKLSELLKMDKRYPDYPKQGAQIIAKDSSNWFDTYLINKGENDGVLKHMVVLGAGGLAGQIMESGSNYAKVLSILDDTSKISAMSLRSEDVGIVKGDRTLMKEGLCRMDYVDNNAQILEGDEIVTSPLSDIFPAGLTIGTVKEVRSDANGFTKYAIIQPAVNFKNIDSFLIVTEKFTALEEVLALDEGK